MPKTWWVDKKNGVSPLPMSLIVFWTKIPGTPLDCRDPRRSDAASTTIESSGQITKFMLCGDNRRYLVPKQAQTRRGTGPKSGRSNSPGITQAELEHRCAEPHSLTANYPG